MSKAQVTLAWGRLLMGSIFRPVSFMVPGASMRENVSSLSSYLLSSSPHLIVLNARKSSTVAKYSSELDVWVNGYLVFVGEAQTADTDLQQAENEILIKAKGTSTYHYSLLFLVTSTSCF